MALIFINMNKTFHVFLFLCFIYFPKVISDPDIGSHFMLPCNITSNRTSHVSWLKDGRLMNFNSSYDHPIYTRSGLLFSPLQSSDSGNYTCFISTLYEFMEFTTKLIVNTPPARLVNVSVHASTVVATVRWHVDKDGGYPITNFTLVYKPSGRNNNDEEWRMPQPLHISPAIRQFFVYQLKPGTDYTFKIWATNKLGHGEAVAITTSTCKPVDPPEVFRKILAGAENFGSTAWLLVFCMLAITVLILLLISCSLVIKEQRILGTAETIPRIITNPGYDIDIEQCFLLDHADFNDNTEKPLRLNNNTVILPSRV